MKRIGKGIAVFLICAVLTGCSINQKIIPEEKSSSGTSGSSVSETSADSSSDSSSTAGSSAEAISFDSQDLDGNAVNNSILKGKKLTMINFWATYCGPCINEIPELAELSSQYAGQGFQIIGVPVDVQDSAGNVDADGIELAKKILSSSGAGYLNILPAEGMTVLLSQVQAVPTTFFVDENGRQVGSSYVGAKSRTGWAGVIEDLLGE